MASDSDVWRAGVAERCGYASSTARRPSPWKRRNTENVRARLIALGIEVSDDPTLDKIKSAYKDIMQLDLRKAASNDGAGAAAALVPTAVSILSIVRKVAA